MSVRWTHASLLAMLFALGGRALEARATTLAPLTVEQLTDGSTYIVEGKVLEVWTELDDTSAMVWTRARVQVTRTLKGPDEPQELVIESPGGKYGAFDVKVPAHAVFSVDEDVFLFLDESRDGHLRPAGMFLGKYTIRRAPGDTESYARTWNSTANEPFDARFLPHPEKGDRVYLADLEDRVVAELRVGWDGKAIPGASPEHLQTINLPERRLSHLDNVPTRSTP